MPDTAPLNLFGEAELSAAPTLFAEIVFDRPLDHAYTYGVPDTLRDALAVGKRVLVPFGRGDRQTVGFCVGLTAEQPTRQVKNILQVLDEEAILTPNLLRLTRWLADYYLCGWGQVLNAVVPAGVKDRAGTRSVLLVELIPEMLWPNPVPSLTPKQKKVLQRLQEKAAPIEITQLRQLSQCAAGPIRGLIDKGFARRKVARVENTAVSEPATENAPAAESPSAAAGAYSRPVTAIWAVLETNACARGASSRFCFMESPAAAKRNCIYVPSTR